MSNASRMGVATAHYPCLLGLALQDVASVPRTRDEPLVRSVPG